MSPEEGMMKIVAMFQGIENIAPLIAKEIDEKLGPFTGLYTSRSITSAATVSRLAEDLNLDFRSIKGLGQHGGKYGDCKAVSPRQWLTDALQAIQIIYHFHSSFSRTKETILIVSHAPTIASLVAYCRGTTSNETIRKIADSPGFWNHAYLVFETKTIGRDGIFKLKLLSSC